MRKSAFALAWTLACTPALADKTLIESPDAPKAIGPYSQAIQSGKLVFVSGSPWDGVMWAIVAYTCWNILAMLIFAAKLVRDGRAVSSQEPG